MPITLVVMACIGPFCTYTTGAERFDTLARCERIAPFVAGMARANLTSMMGYPRGGENQSAYSCIDSGSGIVLMSFDSRPDRDTRLARRQD